jgi:choline dehydrogenase-like flavoprotein
LPSAAKSHDRDDGDDNVTVPGFVGQDLWTEYDWNFTTTIQTSLDKRKRDLNSGRVVGGSSIVNGLVWTRGAKTDYDSWTALGNPDWGWGDLEPYFEKVSATSLNVVL